MRGSFSLSLCLILTVNFQHTQTSVTPLMAAAAQGNMDIVERLLHLGANVHLRAANNQ